MQLRKAPTGLSALCAAISLAAATSASADGVTTTLSGYGTVGGSFTSDSNYAYRHDSSEFKGASNDLDLGLESRIGVQAVFDFGAEFSVTVQEVARAGRQILRPGDRVVLRSVRAGLGLDVADRACGARNISAVRFALGRLRRPLVPRAQ